MHPPPEDAGWRRQCLVPSCVTFALAALALAACSTHAPARKLPIVSTTRLWGLRGSACREAAALDRMAPARPRPAGACGAGADSPVLVYEWFGFGGGGRRRADTAHTCPGRPWKCVRTYRPEAFAEADAVLVWVGSRPEARCLPPLRAAHVWVLEHLEAPSYYPQLYDDAFVRRFSLKISYEPDADVVMTAAHPVTDGGAILPASWSHSPWGERREAVVWLSSNCASLNRREALVALLRARLPAARLRLDAFGGCARAAGSEAPASLLPPAGAGGQRPQSAAAKYGAKVRLFSHYRFCLVAENSLAPWYVTEKLLHAFAAGCVPIYYGTADVRAFLPTPSAAVLVTEHASAESLVRKLGRLAAEPDGGGALEGALGWRQNASLVGEWWARLQRMTAAERMPSRGGQMCAVCDAVRRIRCNESEALGAAALGLGLGRDSRHARAGLPLDAAPERKALRAARRPAVEVWPPLMQQQSRRL